MAASPSRSHRERRDRTTEHHARNLLHRHIYSALHLTVRRVSNDLAVIDLGIPQTPFGIDRRSVGGAARDVSTVAKVRLLATAPLSRS